MLLGKINVLAQPMWRGLAEHLRHSVEISESPQPRSKDHTLEEGPMLGPRT